MRGGGGREKPVCCAALPRIAQPFDLPSSATRCDSPGLADKRLGGGAAKAQLVRGAKDETDSWKVTPADWGKEPGEAQGSLIACKL